jgi:hypothetical protein
MHKKTIKYVILIAILITACETPSGYNYSNYYGGFVDVENTDVSNINGSGIYVSRFNGNGFTTTERATDLSLLRCAERAWQDGYNYIAILSGEGQLNQDGTSTTAFAVPLATGGAVAFSNSKPIYKPNSSTMVIGLLNMPKPTQVRSKYTTLKIETYFDEMKKKYKLEKLSMPQEILVNHRNMFNKTKLNFQKNLDENFSELLPKYKNLIKFAAEPIVIDLINGKKGNLNSVLQLGVVNFGEIPFEPFDSSSEEFKTFLKRKAQEVNSNLIIIDHEVDQEESNTVFKELFSVVFCYRLDVKLDVAFDPQANVTKEIKVRNVYRTGGELQYGDVILAVDGVDVLTVGKNVKDFGDVVTYLLLGKKAGEDVALDVIRNNKPIKVVVKLFANK